MLYTDEVLSKKKEKKRIRKHIVTVMIYIIVIPMLIYNISLIVQAVVNPNKTPSFFGIKTYVVVSGSMEPQIKIGDIVIAKSVNSEELKEGDIICFRQGQSVITHRISKIMKTNNGIEYKTKGDNNNTEDNGIITDKVIEGKVINQISYLGNVSLMLQNKIVILVAIVMFYVYMIHLNSTKRKRDERNYKRLKHEENNEIN